MFTLYKVWPELLSSDMCDEIVECAKKIELFESKVSRNNEYNPNHRRSNICFIPKNNEDFSEIYPYINKLMHDANAECFGINLIRMQNIQFSEYSSDNEGHFDYHMDTFFDKGSLYQRKLTLCLQLTDPNDYEGGNFEFSNLHFNQDELRKKGTILVFPSFLFHRVTPVTKGVRHSLVTWYEGMRWQ